MLNTVRFYIALWLGTAAIYIAPPKADFRLVRKINWR